MLAMLRTSRRIIGSALALLVLSSWLSVAVAACIDHAQAGSQPMAAMGDMAGHDCPHCDSQPSATGTACADKADNCKPPPVVLSSVHDEFQLAAIAEHPAGVPVPVLRPHAIIPVATSPPAPSGRDLHVLYCSFQE